MVAFPACKINLGLHVISKRPDGFHNIETCFYPVPWTDIVEIIPSNKFAFSSSGIPVPGDISTNLCMKAYTFLQQDFNLPPVQIHLHKILPMGAGLGGGSSDGAHALILLNTIFNLSLTQDQLGVYAAKLGSDCAFFLNDVPMMGTEKGDVLSPLSVNLKGKILVIVKPPIHVSTLEAYRGVKPSTPEVSIEAIIENHPITEWKRLLRNDFEESVFKKYPRIKEIKELMYSKDALYAAMTGSGSAVYGIFNSPVSMNEFSDWAHWTGTL